MGVSVVIFRSNGKHHLLTSIPIWEKTGIGGERRIDLQDAVSLAPMLWEDVITGSAKCVSHVCTEHNETYGQVIFYDGEILSGMGPGFDGCYYGKKEPNCTVITQVDNRLYKERLEKLLTM